MLLLASVSGSSMRNIFALFLAVAGLVCISAGAAVTFLHYLTNHR